VAALPDAVVTVSARDRQRKIGNEHKRIAALPTPYNRPTSRPSSSPTRPFCQWATRCALVGRAPRGANPTNTIC